MLGEQATGESGSGLERHGTIYFLYVSIVCLQGYCVIGNCQPLPVSCHKHGAFFLPWLWAISRLLGDVTHSQTSPAQAPVPGAAVCMPKLL